MNTLVLYNEKCKVNIENFIVKALSNIQASKLNIIFTSDISKIELKDYIVVVIGNTSYRKLKKVDKTAHIIVDANNKGSIKALMCCKAKVYTCGFSGKDYITFSSRCESEAVVSLQRDIKLISKKTYEPFEIPCLLKDSYNDYSILASVLIMILLEIIDDKLINPIVF